LGGKKKNLAQRGSPRPIIREMTEKGVLRVGDFKKRGRGGKVKGVGVDSKSA